MAFLYIDSTNYKLQTRPTIKSAKKLRETTKIVSSGRIRQHPKRKIGKAKKKIKKQKTKERKKETNKPSPGPSN